MVKVNFATSDFKRAVADASALILKNRYFEKNPFLTDDGAALLARPGLKRFLPVGDGPIRGMFSEPGAFNGDLFVVSYDTLYRIDQDLNITTIQSGLHEPDKGFVNMAITANIGTEVPEYLYVADGQILYVYDGTTCSQVATPDDVGVVDVAVIDSYVIVIPAQGQDINGRFYWIEPGETTIDPLNFATAESSPDAVLGVEVLGDTFILPGESTAEVWYATGDAAAPMQRLQGVVFDRGTWEATAASIDENLIICDANGGVFLISGGAPKRISTPDVEELIRKAIQLQQNLTL